MEWTSKLGKGSRQLAAFLDRDQSHATTLLFSIFTCVYIYKVFTRYLQYLNCAFNSDFSIRRLVITARVRVHHRRVRVDVLLASPLAPPLRALGLNAGKYVLILGYGLEKSSKLSQAAFCRNTLCSIITNRPNDGINYEVFPFADFNLYNTVLAAQFMKIQTFHFHI